VKNKDFCRIYSTISIFEQTQGFQWAGVSMTEVTIIWLPGWLTVKQKFSKWMTGNRNAN